MTVGEVWAFDVDGCLVDSMSGTSLRPYAREVLQALSDTGRTLVAWSAGGKDHARAMAERHGLGHLLAGCYDKAGHDAEARLTTTHLPPAHVPAVVVDDRPEDAPAGTRVHAVTPYIAPDPHDEGLLALLRDPDAPPSRGGASMHVVVDKAKCTGHARCADVAPDLFGLDELGYVAVDELEVPPGLEQQARAGAGACPERAITLR